MKQGDKVYQSIFVTGLTVDITNYLTEILIKNWLVRWNKPIPQSPFWRKEITDKSPNLKDLGKRYTIEVSEIKNLLKVFNEVALIDFFKTYKPTTIKYLKLPERHKFTYELYAHQLKLLKAATKLKEEAIGIVIDSHDNIVTNTYQSKVFSQSKPISILD